jgi:hypothetical protein
MRDLADAERIRPWMTAAPGDYAYVHLPDLLGLKAPLSSGSWAMDAAARRIGVTP